MVKKYCFFVVFFLINFFSYAQDIVFKEKINNDYTRFFYDDNYFLVDKNCEFKSIERVAQFDTITLRFHGEFKDFNNQGKLILHGFYKNGKKDGAFTAYHPNGKVKWKSTFIDNDESGLWSYYYPDGKPMLVISLDSADFKFVDFWDTFGNQKIKSGEGKYNINIPIKGFTDHGYASYNTKGIIKNGKPDGNWSTSFITDGKKKELVQVFTETFADEKRTSSHLSPDFIGLFIPYEDFQLVPSDFFGRSELFIFNNCSFDEYSGFKNFTARKINHNLSTFTFNIPNTSFQVEVKYAVTKKGFPSNIELINSPDDLNKNVKNRIMGIFNAIGYFIPSILNGEPIKDNITITGDFINNNGNLRLSHLDIKREKGQ
ncbi:toxin-antitoxin system YwqK family antitoxin [Sphingobacterium bovistauri]|uniref:MORN repeat variant n=1 Tax=Sphingobacterium bovistauri TaxID=2781959 RepID=A0ABS7ZAE5_9SPHI|nr:hypothetical protein [Sphingobacterium bovistauri]MCA5005889.1 hypothetical protein [Sphingobacterium bovistauri]